jgi:LacI family transcriptional regulator
MTQAHAGERKIVRRQRPLVVLSIQPDRRLGEAAGHAIAEQAREFGWDLLDLRFTHGSLPEDRPLSGALIDSLPTDPLAKRLRKMGCPAVRLGRLPHPKDDLLPAVLPDTLAIGRLAADHFAERQFRHMAYIGRTIWSMSQSMYEAFRDRAEELGSTCHLLRLESGPKERGAARYDRRAREVGEWLRTRPKPLGLLSFSDSEAASICTMCRRAGLSVPEDVAVLGLGNALLDCEMAPVELSSIDPARDEWGKQAAQLLQSLMQGTPAPPAPILIPPHGVVARLSTDVLAVADPAVARAMRFMWDHLDLNLSVDDVAADGGVPRRHLERAFRTHLGRGINAELSRKRLERCRELLTRSDLPVCDIATAIGFRSQSYLHATFRRAYGMTPREFRLRNAG